MAAEIKTKQIEIKSGCGLKIGFFKYYNKKFFKSQVQITIKKRPMVFGNQGRQEIFQTSTEKMPIGFLGLEFGRTRWLARRQVEVDII